MIMVLVSYDISFDDAEGPARLRKVAKLCKDYGVRVQYSIFECEMDIARWVHFRDKLLSLIDTDVDSLRFYRLGKGWRDKVEHHGAKPAIDLFKGSLII